MTISTRLRRLLVSFIVLIILFIPEPSQSENSFSAHSKISSALKTHIDDSGLDAQYDVWIFLKDKGRGLENKTAEVEWPLNIRSIKRRMRREGHRPLVDYYDIPVDRNYITRLQPLLKRFRHQSRWLNAVSASVSGRHIFAIAEQHFVTRLDTIHRFIYRDPVLPEGETPPLLSQETHLFDYGPSCNQVNQIGVPALHDQGFSGNGVLICMLDSGFNNLDHQALLPLDIRAAWDFVNGNADVRDEVNDMGVGDHGTNTLGAIGGFFPGKLLGPAFGASYILGKTENTEWERHIEEDHWVAGAEWADQMGADIISSSLGYRDQFTHGEMNYSSEDMDGKTTVVSQAANIAASRGILVVNSAGNEGDNPFRDNTIIAPADSPGVLAVGAVNPQGYIVNFSSYGPTADGRIKPDVSAQGRSVYTASDQNDSGYVSVNGTSFSCPLTAGAAALLLEIHPGWSNRDIIAALKNTAGRALQPDNYYGWGIIDTAKASRYQMKNIHAPQEFALERVENDYIFFRQYVDRICWKHNPRNQDRTAAYRLYARKLGQPGADFELLAELDSSVFFFLRRGLLADETYLYKITAVSRSGEESDPNYTRGRS
jgi:serine protease AprX